MSPAVQSQGAGWRRAASAAAQRQKGDRKVKNPGAEEDCEDDAIKLVDGLVSQTEEEQDGAELDTLTDAIEKSLELRGIWNGGGVEELVDAENGDGNPGKPGPEQVGLGAI